MAVLNNVVFFYCKIQNPVPAFNKVDSEWSVDAVVTKADAQALVKQFPKTSLKKYDHDEFREKFKADPPFPDEAVQHVLKFRKAHTKNGKTTPEKYRPRVVQETPNGRIDVTFDKQVGNGSRGDLSYRIKETDTYGSFVELQAILVKDLVEYEGKGVTSDFGDVQLAPAPAREVVANVQGGGSVDDVDGDSSEIDYDDLPFN